MSDQTAVQRMPARGWWPTGGGRAAPLLLLLLVLAFPLVTQSQYQLFVATQVGVYLLVAIGLNVLTGYAGQPSIGHGALVAIGAYGCAILTVDHGWPFWPAAAAGMTAAAFGGALMALPALRVSTWYFALITLGFAHVVSAMLIEWGALTHAFDGIVGIATPTLFGRPLGARELFWLVAAANVGCFLLVRNLVRSRIGRGLMAVRDNPAAALASGVSIVGLKMFAFVLSAAVAGLAGALYAVQKTVITPDDFTAEFSIFFLVVVVLGGPGRLWGPIAGTLTFFVVPELLEALQGWRLLIYGVVLLVLMRFAPTGLVGAVETVVQLWSPGGRAELPSRPAGAPLPPVPGGRLEIQGIGKRFGGVTALGDVSLDVPAGSVHAIVGPNGSGKTTLLNLISGYYRPDNGSVRLDARDITGRRPALLARLGIGRTFQTPKLVPELPVLDNVMLGGYAAERAGVTELALRLPRARREDADQRDRARTVLAFVGLDARASVPAGEIPHGQQRLAEIARSLVASPRVLLLDEPAAGLSLDELDRLAALIKAIASRGTTVVIVEHHLDLVGSICDAVTVLDRGRIIAAGSPASVFSNPAVLDAYMGRRGLEAAS